MNLIQLSYFVRICEVESFSKAATLLGIAQPALSRQVRALEQELDAALLVRHAWGVSPTPAGETLLEQARVILRQVDSARDAVHAIEQEPTGSVALGAPSSIAVALFPPLLSALRADYPKLRPQLIDELSSALHQRTLRGELDLAILHGGRPLGPFAATPLLTEGLGLVGSPALTAAYTPARLTSLTDLPMLVSTSLNRSRLTLETLLKGRPIDIVAEVDCMPAMLRMLADGHGFALLPYSAAHAMLTAGSLVFTDLARPDLKRDLVIVRPIDRPLTPATVAIERMIRQLASSMEAQMRWTCVGERAVEAPAGE